MKAEGEGTHIFDLGIHGCLVVQGREGEEALKLQGEALKGRYNVIMDSSKFGID